MISESKIIQKAEFNPNIKNYFLILICFYMLISVVGIPLIIIWLLGIGQYVSRRYYENLICQLTERHLEFKKGVLFKVEKTIPLENIQDITFIENPLLKFFNLRILRIETAGQSNPQGSDMELMGIINTQEFKQMVLEQREILILSKQDSKTTSESDKDQTIELLKEIRDILNDIKNKYS